MWHPRTLAGLAILLTLLLGQPPASILAKEKEEPDKRPGRLAINLTVPKGPVGPKEPVPVTLRLMNVGEQPIAFNSRLLLNAPGKPGEVTVKVLGPDKRERPFTAWIVAEGESEAWMLLEPRMMLTRTWDLRKTHDLAGEGFYALQFVYENSQDAPAELERPAWKGRLASRAVRFLGVAGEEEK